MKKIALLVLPILLASCQTVTSYSDSSDSDRSDYNNSDNLKQLKYISSNILTNDYCDQIIDNQFIKICYSYPLKSAKAVVYNLEGDLVNETNIKDRPNFYEEPTLETTYRATYRDYTNSGYDRGHMAPDAAFDWSNDSLEAVYTLANIVPQVPDVNQHAWVKAEEHARKEAVIHGTVTVINLIKYSNKPERIGKNSIAVAEGFYKIIYNQEDKYNECFYYKNEYNTATNLTSHAINCETIRP